MRNEMVTLIDRLASANIPFELTTDVCGNENGQLWYPSRENHICDVICHEYSYGGDEGLLEIMGLLDEEESEYDDVIGWLTAENVFARIYTDFMNQ